MLPEHLLVEAPDNAIVCLSSYLVWLTGIGRATAVALSKAGWSLVLFARRFDQLRETKELCEEPSKCLCIAGDVSDEKSVEDLFKNAVQTFGRFLFAAYRLFNS